MNEKELNFVEVFITLHGSDLTSTVRALGKIAERWEARKIAPFLKHLLDSQIRAGLYDSKVLKYVDLGLEAFYEEVRGDPIGQRADVVTPLTAEWIAGRLHSHVNSGTISQLLEELKKK